MKKRVRFLSVKGGVGKSTFSLILVNTLIERSIPFIIEELDPLQGVCLYTSCDFSENVIIYYSINDFLYGDLKINKKEIKKKMDKIQWNISVADMFTGTDPDSDVVIFQNSITNKNLNVFLTDAQNIEITADYARKWEGTRILIVNQVFEQDISSAEDKVLDYVYGEGLFVKAYVVPFFSSVLELESSSQIRQITSEMLNILNEI